VWSGFLSAPALKGEADAGKRAQDAQQQRFVVIIGGRSGSSNLPDRRSPRREMDGGKRPECRRDETGIRRRVVTGRLVSSHGWLLLEQS
jgi:hypothetical protein